MKKYFVSIFLIITFNYGFSQDKLVKEEVNKTQTTTELTQAVQHPVEGTYQIIVSGKNAIANVPEEFLLQIESKREYDKIVYIKVNDYIKIKVLPFNIIRDKEFRSLNKYSYEK